MTLWIVGKNLTHPSEPETLNWEFQGIYDDVRVAEDRCVNWRWFVGPVTLNQYIPSEPQEWIGVYYPNQSWEGLDEDTMEEE